MGLYMNGECNATNVQGKNYNLHKLQGGGHVPQCPIAGDASGRHDLPIHYGFYGTAIMIKCSLLFSAPIVKHFQAKKSPLTWPVAINQC